MNQNLKIWRARPSQKHGPWLINMQLDDREAYDVSLHEPDRAKSMRNALLVKRKEMEENLRGWVD